MAFESSLAISVDSREAEQGARRVEQALDRVGASAERMRKSTCGAFDKLLQLSLTGISALADLRTAVGTVDAAFVAFADGMKRPTHSLGDAVSKLEDQLSSLSDTIGQAGPLDGMAEAVRTITKDLSDPAATKGVISLGRALSDVIELLAENRDVVLEVTGGLTSFLELRSSNIRMTSNIPAGNTVTSGVWELLSSEEAELAKDIIEAEQEWDRIESIIMSELVRQEELRPPSLPVDLDALNEVLLLERDIKGLMQKQDEIRRGMNETENMISNLRRSRLIAGDETAAIAPAFRTNLVTTQQTATSGVPELRSPEEVELAKDLIEARQEWHRI